MIDKMEYPKIFPLGDNALTIEFGHKITPELNDRALELFQYFQRNPFVGLIETLPAYCSLTVFYDVYEVRKNYPKDPPAFGIVKSIVENALSNLVKIGRTPSRLIEIPVDFRVESAPDLGFVATNAGLSPKKVVEIFTSQIYRVFMLGFLPGFAYLGEVDERIAAPRKAAPRLIVPKGSVGLAGRQTGIYPLESPGGWQLIGQTEFELFTPFDDRPCTLQAGDSVKFVDSGK